MAVSRLDTFVHRVHVVVLVVVGVEWGGGRVLGLFLDVMNSHLCLST